MVSAFASELPVSGLMPEQVRALRAIEQCRTAALGGHLDVCECGFERPSYNSCRNRHCPKCQHLAQALWLDGREQHLLPVDYFHVVFTLPSALRALVLTNRRALFDLLFQTASRTLLQLGHDPDRLGAEIGFTAVLHTWNQELLFHPHLHCIVTGGGLDDEDQQRFRRVRGGRFLFPVQVISRLFRGKFLGGLVRLRNKGQLRFIGEATALAQGDVFHALLAKLQSQEWNVYAKRPLAGAQQVYRYLGRYTHRVAIGNSRLLAMDDREVRFRTKDGREITLPGPVFLSRFLLHVLPAGFVKIRHYGLLAPANVHTKLEQARCCLGLQPSPSEPALAPCADWRQRLLDLTGVDLRLCPRCHAVLVAHPLPRAAAVPASEARSPPASP